MRSRVPPVLWTYPHAHDGTETDDLDCLSQLYLNRSKEKEETFELFTSFFLTFHL